LQHLGMFIRPSLKKKKKKNRNEINLQTSKTSLASWASKMFQLKKRGKKKKKKKTVTPPCVSQPPAPSKRCFAFYSQGLTNLTPPPGIRMKKILGEVSVAGSAVAVGMRVGLVRY